MLKFITAGESHGKGVLVVIDGMPANVPISSEYIQKEMQKRKKGSGSGGRQMIEDDKTKIVSGVRFGKTIGSPITLYVENKDFKNWGDKMSSVPQPKDFIDSIKVVNPRPGHADLTGSQKYGFDDVRNVLERASARETTGRVAAGAIFKQFLRQFSIEIASHTIQIGTVKVTKDYTFKDIQQTYEKDPTIRCVDSEASARMQEEIKKTRMAMDTLGGVVEIWAVNVPPGLGSYVQYDRKIDGQMAQALMSIPSVKAVEIGEGVKAAGWNGSQVQDEIYYSKKQGYYRKTNRAGGVEGGVTNGMPLISRAYHKPISTLYKPLNTVNIKTKEPAKATVERSDICQVPRGGVISESMISFILTKNVLEKFGSDNMDDIIEAYNSYIKRADWQKMY